MKTLKIISMPKYVRPRIQVNCVTGGMEWLLIEVSFAPGKLY